MKRMTMGAVATLIALTALAPLALEGQERERPERGERPGWAMRGGRGPMMGRGPGVEGIMRLRERLELTDEQAARLDEIRTESVEQRTAQQSRMAEIRSRVTAGEMDPEAAREAARGLMESAAREREQVRERVEAVLTQEQMDTLAEVRTAARERAMERRRDGEVRRGEPGARRGRPGGFMRGPGGPGASGRTPGG